MQEITFLYTFIMSFCSIFFIYFCIWFTWANDRHGDVMIAKVNPHIDNLFVLTVHTNNLIYFPSHNLHNLLDLQFNTKKYKSISPLISFILKKKQTNTKFDLTHPVVTTSHQLRLERVLDHDLETVISDWVDVRNGFLSIQFEIHNKIIK